MFEGPYFVLVPGVKDHMKTAAQKYTYDPTHGLKQGKDFKLNFYIFRSTT